MYNSNTKVAVCNSIKSSLKSTAASARLQLSRRDIVWYPVVPSQKMAESHEMFAVIVLRKRLSGMVIDSYHQYLQYNLTNLRD